MTHARGRPPFPDQLTPAEWRVVEAVRHGLSNPDIARRQGVSLDAVKYHVANALQKLGLSNRKALMQWSGVALASALSAQRKPPVMDVQLGPVGQISRSVSDIEAAKHWYGEVLGLPFLYAFGNLAFFDCGGLRLFLSEGDGDANSIVYFRVADIHAASQSLQQRGVEFINAPHMIHKHADGVEEWMTFLKDNEGRPLALMSSVAPAAAGVQP
jgi:DNA-binding CsgD family transcriptional regulator/catechol 2,3-dioxygenase-like lactoylglutathione lyase family enzyme